MKCRLLDQRLCANGKYAIPDDAEHARMGAAGMMRAWNADRLANPSPQELPDLLGGLGCLGGAGQELVDVRQALAGLQGDVDPGFGCCCGQALGVAEQQVGRAYLYKQRREPGQ